MLSMIGTRAEVQVRRGPCPSHSRHRQFSLEAPTLTANRSQVPSRATAAGTRLLLSIKSTHRVLLPGDDPSGIRDALSVADHPQSNHDISRLLFVSVARGFVSWRGANGRRREHSRNCKEQPSRRCRELVDLRRDLNAHYIQYFVCHIPLTLSNYAEYFLKYTCRFYSANL